MRTSPARRWSPRCAPRPIRGQALPGQGTRGGRVCGEGQGEKARRRRQLPPRTTKPGPALVKFHVMAWCWLKSCQRSEEPKYPVLAWLNPGVLDKHRNRPRHPN